MENRGLIAPRIGFGEGLCDAVKDFPNIITLGADITNSVGIGIFKEKYPERHISLGIAEQNCVGVAAGLALEGKIPVFSTYAVFAAFRAADQIRVSVCYNNLHVIIAGAHAGISVGPDGATHQALEDIAVMRTLPNMTVISPCDATQLRKATYQAIAKCKGPVYLRFGREPIPDFTDIDEPFEIGKGIVYREGNDVGIIATGSMVWEALIAANELEKLGISATVVNLHTIKPLDEELILKVAKNVNFIVTAEEHQKAGGMGSAICEFLSENYPCRILKIGIDDKFGESGLARELMKKYSIDADAIVKCVLKRINQ